MDSDPSPSIRWPVDPFLRFCLVVAWASAGLDLAAVSWQICPSAAAFSVGTPSWLPGAKRCAKGRDWGHGILLDTVWIIPPFPTVSHPKVMQFRLHLIVNGLVSGKLWTGNTTKIHGKKSLAIFLVQPVPWRCTWPRIAASDAVFQRGSWLAIDGTQGPGITLRWWDDGSPNAMEIPKESINTYDV